MSETRGRKSEVRGQRPDIGELTNAKRGITLIALIITVIILLILAGTAISISINGGDLFGKSQNAVAQYNNRVAEENTAITELFGILDSMGGVKQVNDANPGVLEGNGSEADPYTINCIEDLVAFAYNVNSYDQNNNTGTLYEGKTVALALDLDFQSDKSYANPETKYILDDNGYTPNSSGTAIKTLLTDTSGVGFIPVGNGESDGFAGTIDGQNHALINLYENSSTYGGLLGKTKNAITIRNLGMKTCNITGINHVGSFIGQASSTVTIINCYNTGYINSTIMNTRAGGIIASADSTVIINNCYNLGDIATQNIAGGILGFASSTVTITNCYNTGRVTSNVPAGGIVGFASNTAKVINCHNTGDISSTGIAPAGGIAGQASSTLTITNCYNTGDVNSAGAPAGGILGYANSTAITNCYNTGDVNSASSYAGGILGEATSATITNCYNTGDVTTASSYAGGILGEATSATITNCYNTGDVTSASSYAGGILGFANSTPTITNCHNTGNVIGTNTGEIIGTGGTAGTGCTYLTKETNANANGATGVADMTETMSMANFVARMNQYVETNNADNTKPQLKTWTLSNGYPVFSN